MDRRTKGASAPVEGVPPPEGGKLPKERWQSGRQRYSQGRGSGFSVDTPVRKLSHVRWHVTGESQGKRASGKTAARYDRIAPVYDMMQAGMERMARKWRALLWAEVKEASKVLEVGVGTGKNMPFYPPGAEVVAIDLSERMLERARRRAEREGVRVDLQQMDVQCLSFPDASFDAAVASFVFCSVPDAVKGLREVGRVTAPRGKIVLLEHMRPRSPWLARLFDVANPIVVRLLGFNINRRTRENVREAGLDIESVRELDRGGIFKLIVAHPGKERCSERGQPPGKESRANGGAEQRGTPKR